MIDKADQQPIAVIGAGSWGTALALQLARYKNTVKLGGTYEIDLLKKMVIDCENIQYLPNIKFPKNISVYPQLNDCLEDVHDVLIVVPSHGLRSTLTQILPFLHENSRICWATKGFELVSGKLPHQVVAEVLGKTRPVAVLSGPTFANEVAKGLPTAMTIASNNAEFGASLASRISGENFRAYTSDDLIGVEVGGAVKNVLAIGAGICDGLEFGANARIALITRGLVELKRLGIALGARNETIMGLAGMGDLVLTCTDNLSRNRRMGLAIAKGISVEKAQNEIKQVVEGVLAAKAVNEVAKNLKIEMPICYQVFRILYEKASPLEAVGKLMGRELKSEND